MELISLALSPERVLQAAVTEIVRTNERSQQYGLCLTPKDAKELALTREYSLRTSGRLEFGGGIVSKLIYAFCDSPYLYQSNYASVLNELTETFYLYKNETMDLLGDDELISLMKEYFDHRCGGSIELLQGRELYLLARNLRFGVRDYLNLSQEDESRDSGTEVF